MYSSFFDLREKPFKLVPNPEFLFLSKSHEEALAHLAYATSQGDGFVKITGEVGTGKTTLCRVFLEGLGEDVEAAFIFNSKLNSVQLLKAVHRELGIFCENDDPADMTFALYEFLLEKKTEGKSVILLIDEAQNMGFETLEQLRLLSNLETTRSKLLQIILVGQPELEDILDSYDMRQLRQRINLTCHVLPMSPKETRKYIEHRINVASRKPQTLFTRGALNKISKYSRGIPRLINIICDRSLLAAYSINQKKVTSATIKIAIRELDTQQSYAAQSSRSNLMKTMWTFVAISVFILVPLAIYLKINMGWEIQKSKIVMEKTENKPETLPKVLLPVSADTEEQPNIIEKDFADDPITIVLPSIEKMMAEEVVYNEANFATREKMFAHVLSLWGEQPIKVFNRPIDRIESDSSYFEVMATLNNYHLMHIKKAYHLINKFNLPAIISFIQPGSSAKKFFAITKITPNDDYILFAGEEDKRVSVNCTDLHSYLTGDIYIIWKDTLGYNRIISGGSSEASIISIKLRLKNLGFSDIDLTPVYDTPVINAVKLIQEEYGLTPDGLVGPLTKLILYNVKKDNSVPYLDNSRFKPESGKDYAE